MCVPNKCTCLPIKLQWIWTFCFSSLLSERDIFIINILGNFCRIVHLLSNMAISTCHLLVQISYTVVYKGAATGGDMLLIGYNHLNHLIKFCAPHIYVFTFLCTSKYLAKRNTLFINNKLQPTQYVILNVDFLYTHPLLWRLPRVFVLRKASIYHICHSIHICVSNNKQ